LVSRAPPALLLPFLLCLHCCFLFFLSLHIAVTLNVSLFLLHGSVTHRTWSAMSWKHPRFLRPTHLLPQVPSLCVPWPQNLQSVPTDFKT
jgi:hypothetical protein